MVMLKIDYLHLIKYQFYFFFIEPAELKWINKRTLSERAEFVSLQQASDVIDAETTRWRRWLLKMANSKRAPSISINWCEIKLVS